MFKIIYGIGLVLIVMIRVVYLWRARNNRIVVDHKTARERSLLTLMRGGLLLPLVYLFTPWLRFADYQLPFWAGWIGS